MASSEVSLATTVSGVPFAKVLLNSANPIATTAEDLDALAASPATGAFTTRTACPNFEHDDSKHQWRAWKSSESTTECGNTINCLGYSSQTIEYYLEAVKHVQSKHSKPAVISISGYAAEISTMLADIGSAFAADKDNRVLVEINLSCPNIPGKPPIAYDESGMKDYLTEALAAGTHGLTVGVKLTPYFYDGQFVQAATVINEFEGISFVTCINTVGSGLVIDVDKEAPILHEAGSALGGLGGPAVHATALANVYRMRQLLRPSIAVIGCGGVDSGAAAFSHLLCGASAVMVASALLTRGIGVMEKIQEELVEIMSRKGYTCIEDFRGKLKS